MSAKPLPERGEVVSGGRRRRRDPKSRRTELRGPLQGALRIFGEREDIPDIGPQHLASRCQPNTSPHAFEETSPTLALQLSDLDAHRGGRDGEGLGGLRKASGSYDR